MRRGGGRVWLTVNKDQAAGHTENRWLPGVYLGFFFLKDGSVQSVITRGSDLQINTGCVARQNSGGVAMIRFRV